VERPRTHFDHTQARQFAVTGAVNSLLFCFPKIRLPRYRLLMTDKPESDLAMAARHATEGHRIVAQQRVNGSPD
jgi:hypothetical protein